MTSAKTEYNSFKNAESTGEFSPVVTATCKTGVMAIHIQFNQPFNGVTHAREFRTPACMALGNGTESLSFDINLMAPQGAPDYCGVFWNNRTDERSLPLAVRVHRTLELADDKFYVITCGKAGFRNARNETSLVSLRMLDSQGRKVLNAAFGLPYTLRAEISKPDGTHGIRLKNCFAFNMRNYTADLLDNRGCPMKQQSLVVKSETGAAELAIASMFRFPDSSQVNFQCDIAICKGTCSVIDCSTEARYEKGDEESTVTASTGIFVLDPNDNGAYYFQVIEKDPSVVEDYDPYRSWHGSQYGSRYPSSTIHSARYVTYKLFLWHLCYT
ncbi:hypothetical protein HF086_007531, partial [Spodoptera exigua]